MSSTEPFDQEDDLLPEYSFDYSKARSNRFTAQKLGRRIVLLEPNVAEVFTTPEAVNAVLRACGQNKLY